MKKCKKLLVVVLTFILALSLASCGNKDKQVNSDANKDSKESILKVVATSEDYKTLFDKFTKDKGVKVETLSMSSGDVLSRIKAEGDNKMADVWFGGGIDAFMAAKSEDLLAEVKFEGSDKINEKFKDADNKWFTKGVTVVGFIVNPTVLKEKNLPEPKTWDDLTNPKYKDQIIMSNPAISGTNYAVLNSIIQVKGEEAGWKYFEDLTKNIPFYSKRGKDPALKVSEGEFAIGITYIDKTLDNMIEDKGLKIIYPQDGMPWIPDGVAVFKGCDNEDAANEFMKWLYTDENLKMLMDIDKKNTLKLVTKDIQGVELEFDEKSLLKLDLKQFGEKREAMLEKWKTVIGDKAEE